MGKPIISFRVINPEAQTVDKTGFQAGTLENQYLFGQKHNLI